MTKIGFRFLPTFFVLFGSGNLGSGLWMFVAPAHWFQHYPFSVSELGPFNAHFVRDVGAFLTMLGLGLILTARKAEQQQTLFGLLTLVYVLHSLIHLFPAGSSAPIGTRLWVDLPWVYLPTLVLVGVYLRFYLYRRPGSG